MPKPTVAKPKPAAGRKLKDYRAPAGFYDAYVAAPSQKAAIEALGADNNLFARGDGEMVTDPALTGEPLAHPGEVIKRKRGTFSEQLAALAPTRAKRDRKADIDGAEETKPGPVRLRRPAAAKPRPSRTARDEAEQALARFEAKAKLELADIRAREAALAKERKTLEAAHAAQRSRLDRAAVRERGRYEAALAKWRSALE